jgi:ribokinase
MKNESDDQSSNVGAIRISLQGLHESGPVSVLPDYFIDRFVKIPSLDGLTSDIKSKSLEGGGGSLRGIAQNEVKGGNAVNVAYALGKFGAKVKLLAIAEGLGALTLESTFQEMKNVEVEIVPGKHGLTVALEFVEGGRHVNIMLSDTGGVAEFDGSVLPFQTIDNLVSSKIVCIVNWAANRKGTELCSRIYSQAKKRGALTFFDPADLAQLAHNIPKLQKEIFDQGLLDFISLNDNELRILCRALTNESVPQDYSFGDLTKAVKFVSQSTHARVDLHTRSVSLSCKDSDLTLLKCHKVEQRIVTGAGDVWDAGDLIGYLLNWESETRLRFANAAAGLYVSGENAEPPDLGEVLGFMERHDEFY